MNPVTVNVAGVASEASAETGVTLAPGQASVTVTLPLMLGTKSLATVNVLLLSVLMIVHEPELSAAEHVPVEEYPPGMEDSVPAQLGLPVYPLTVNVAGVASDALAAAGDTVPEAQDSETVTLAPLFGTKSFFTWNDALVSVLVMVQDPVERAAEQVPVEE